MNKNIRDIVALVLVALGFFLLPTVINDFFVEKKTDTFFERVDENYNDCLKNTNEDAKEIRLCKEIKSASELAFSFSKGVSDSNSNISITQGILFLLAAIIFNLRSRIEVLEKK